MLPLAIATGVFVAFSAPTADFVLEWHDMQRRSEALARQVGRELSKTSPNLEQQLRRAMRNPQPEEIEAVRVVDFSGATLARVVRQAGRSWPQVLGKARVDLGGREATLTVTVSEPEWLRRDLVLLGVFSVLGAVLALGLYTFPLGLLREEDLIRLFAWRSERAAEDERRRVSRDLHDGVGQALGAAAVALVRLEAKGGRSEESAEASRLLELALEDVRRVARGLRPPTLDDLGLGAALEGLGREATATGVAVDVAVEALPRIGAELEQTCFRLAQEALANVVRHARATSARLRLERRGGDLVLEVQDDGCGFDPAEAFGLGLVGARERAAQAAGTLAIESAPGRGTRLVAVLPWQEA